MKRTDVALVIVVVVLGLVALLLTALGGGFGFDNSVVYQGF